MTNRDRKGTAGIAAECIEKAAENTTAASRTAKRIGIAAVIFRLHSLTGCTDLDLQLLFKPSTLECARPFPIPAVRHGCGALPCPESAGDRLSGPVERRQVKRDQFAGGDKAGADQFHAGANPGHQFF